MKDQLKSELIAKSAFNAGWDAAIQWMQREFAQPSDRKMIVDYKESWKRYLEREFSNDENVR